MTYSPTTIAKECAEQIQATVLGVALGEEDKIAALILTAAALANLTKL